MPCVALSTSYMNAFNLYNSLEDRYYFYSNFTDKESEVSLTHLPKNPQQGQDSDLGNSCCKSQCSGWHRRNIF